MAEETGRVRCGLGEALDPAQQAVDLARALLGDAARGTCADQRFVDELRDVLDAFAAEHDPIPLTRDNAIAVLQVLVEFLGPAMARATGASGSDLTIITDHPAIDLLAQLSDALHDLNRSKTHEALKPASGATGASLSVRDQKFWATLAATGLAVIQRAKRLPNRQEALKFVGRKLNRLSAGALKARLRRALERER